ncbi:MAG: cupin domain-containing protein [Gammaproteobacteria bacterium]|nr:cupin domain-containing protein [Gammaproteobacteria bacterium]
MKKALIQLFILTLVSGSTPAFADVQLGSREVLLDNQTVEVVRLIYPVGTESGMHSHEHPHRVAYFVKGGKAELIPDDPEQSSKIIEVADGDSLFLPATTHNVKNIGETEIVIIETEIKH